MNNMKCPFCGQAIMCMDAQDADEHSTWYCPRCIAEKAWYAFGNKTLWQELIRTRKALDVAVDALKELKPQKAKGGGYWAVKSADAIKLINTTIKQITALEQKE